MKVLKSNSKAPTNDAVTEKIVSVLENFSARLGKIEQKMFSEDDKGEAEVPAEEVAPAEEAPVEAPVDAPAEEPVAVIDEGVKEAIVEAVEAKLEEFSQKLNKVMKFVGFSEELPEDVEAEIADAVKDAQDTDAVAQDAEFSNNCHSEEGEAEPAPVEEPAAEVVEEVKEAVAEVAEEEGVDPETAAAISEAVTEVVAGEEVTASEEEPAEEGEEVKEPCPECGEEPCTCEKEEEVDFSARYARQKAIFMR